MSSNNLSDTPSTDALTILREFCIQIPKATTPRRLALTIAARDDFRDLVKPYLLSGLTKGVPSLFVDIKALYKDDSKREIVEQIVEAALADFSPNSSSPSSSSAAVEPTTYLWTLYFLAQHYSYLSRPALALSTIELALAHTPTLPELHTCKARALKRAGDPFGAARCVDESRILDGQDRFLNTKCAKYLLRAGLVDEASAILGLFTKVPFPFCMGFDTNLNGRVRRKMLRAPVRIWRTCSLFSTSSKRQTPTITTENSTLR